MVAIDVKSVSKSFKQNKVLNDISFSVQEGKIFGFIGLNGAGKTTLIKIMLDMLNFDAGDVKLFGCDHDEKETKYSYAFLPEKFAPPHLLRGKEFLEFVLSYYKKPYEDKLAEAYAESLKLDKTVLKSKITKYSKGMAQKLGLISAFLTDCPLLILDEPMSGLDPSARISLKRTLQEYKSRGKTVFFSSHILSDIDEICDDVAILHDSKIIYHGKPGDFKKKHKVRDADSLEECFLHATNLSV